MNDPWSDESDIDSCVNSHFHHLLFIQWGGFCSWVNSFITTKRAHHLEVSLCALVWERSCVQHLTLWYLVQIVCSVDASSWNMHSLFCPFAHGILFDLIWTPKYHLEGTDSLNSNSVRLTQLGMHLSLRHCRDLENSSVWFARYCTDWWSGCRELNPDRGSRAQPFWCM